MKLTAVCITAFLVLALYLYIPHVEQKSHYTAYAGFNTTTLFALFDRVVIEHGDQLFYDKTFVRSKLWSPWISGTVRLKSDTVIQGIRSFSIMAASGDEIVMGDGEDVLLYLDGENNTIGLGSESTYEYPSEKVLISGDVYPVRNIARGVVVSTKVYAAPGYDA